MSLYIVASFSSLQEKTNNSEELTFKERISIIESIGEAVNKNKDKLIKSISGDFGYRSKDETLLFEFFSISESIKYIKKNLHSWMKPKHTSVSSWFFPGRAFIKYQPLGIIGISVPWNYPLYLSIIPLISAIAAGNRVMLKMSRHTVRTTKLLNYLISLNNLSDYIVIVKGGINDDIVFSSLPFDHHFFTGSSETGKKVMRAAADNHTPVTLELGGKSPVFIAPFYSGLQNAAKSVVWGKMINAGQTCIAPDFVLIPVNRVNDFIDKIKSAMNIFYPTSQDSQDYSSIYHDYDIERLDSYIHDAIHHGLDVVRIAPGNESVESLRLKGKLPLTLIINPAPENKVMQEEIFGPLLPIIEYENIETAISMMKNTPLAMYIFCDDINLTNDIIKKTRSGSVTVNDTLLHVTQESLPFGGIRTSGCGYYHGHAGFLNFSHQRSIFIQRGINLKSLITPPYSRFFFRLILKLMLKK